MREELQQRIDRLSPAQRILLEQKLQSKIQNSAEIVTITPRNNSRELTLSFAQQRLWFLSLLDPESSIYNRPAYIKLKGQLNISILEQCLKEIIRRHEVIRSNFVSIDGQPTVVISPEYNLSLILADLSLLMIDLQKNNLHQLLRQSIQPKFDLAQDRLVRAGLVKLSLDEHILLLTFHHSIFDGWSMEVLLDELTTLYDAFSQDKLSPLSELEIQYSDFANWQIQRFQRADFQTKLDYWKQQLSGELPILELPIDRPRPAIQMFKGASYIHTLPLDLTHALKQLSQTENVTLFMTLLAAYQVLLCRYSGQTDIIVGTPISGRDRLETENLIGVFINILALRINLAKNPSFQEILAQIKRVALAAYENQEIPFEKLVEALQPERSLSHSPLFQTLFQLRKLPKIWQTDQGLKLEEIKTERGIVGFDLSLDITETTAGLICQFEYNADLFEPATIERMAGHFEVLLTSTVVNPSISIGQLPLLTSAERQQILVDWNDTASAYPHEKCIHQLFEEQVERTPDAIAVIFERQELTYRELNNRANQLAHYLHKLGVKAEVLVGIYLERSLEMIIGILGILKAGGAYVPLDPNYPQDRLKFISIDTQISILLTQEKLANYLKIDIREIVNLDLDLDSIKQESKNNLLGVVESHNLAYVMYTSGSTGQVKGVPIEHRGVVNVTWSRIQSLIKFGELNLAPSTASISFDASVIQIFYPLAVGAALLIPKDIFTLANSPEFSKINYLNSTPSVLTKILENYSIPSSVKVIFLGGEKLQQELIEKLQAFTSIKQIVNAYGPTETTIYSTIATLTIKEKNGLNGLNLALERNKVVIGKPIYNTKIYILDNYLGPVPIGIIGEIYIGGDGLARGYLNRPELTTEKFIINPFGEGKLYRTGDLACYLPDGNIEFLGRIDNQVKIRGFRIELGEIESVLNQHPNILNVVTIAREDTPGDNRIIAYVVSPTPATLTQTELRQFLKQQLPDYMIPSVFIILDKFPLTPNGKIDRRSLPAPNRTRSEIENNFVAPCNELEQQLVKIWSELLQIEQIGIEDNFFILGGHSLLAMKVMSRIQTVYAVSFPLRYLFEYPTIKQLADRIGILIGDRSQIESDIEYEQGQI
jgi:amino acid adenylation domain-containing protein